MVGTYFAQLVHPDDLGAAQEMFGTALEGSFATCDRSCSPRRRQLGAAGRDRQRHRRPGRAATARPCDGPRRHRARPSPGAAPPGAEDGVDRPARRRDRPRLQQPADGDQRLRRADADGLRRRCGPDPRQRRADRARGRESGVADRPAARLQPQAGAAAAADRPERGRRRDGVDAGSHARRGRRPLDRVRPRARADTRRSDPDRAGRPQSRSQRPRRDAGRRQSRDPDGSRSSSASTTSARTRPRARAPT